MEEAANAGQASDIALANEASPPATSISRATVTAASPLFWEFTTTAARSLANRWAIALPIPRLAPVMTAIFPFRLDS